MPGLPMNLKDGTSLARVKWTAHAKNHGSKPLRFPVNRKGMD